MISLVDYGLGNIRALENIFRLIGTETSRVSTPEQLLDSKKLILPGVGAFDWALEKLHKSGMLETLNNVVLEKQVPILGICVGMQMMCKSSEEGQMQGLGWINADVKFFRSNKKHSLPLPHMGWNNIKQIKNCPLFDRLDKMEFYFLHSFYVKSNSSEDVTCLTEYQKSFACALHVNNIYAVQFHPEKSHTNGIRLLKNFAEYC